MNNHSNAINISNGFTSFEVFERSIPFRSTLHDKAIKGLDIRNDMPAKNMFVLQVWTYDVVPFCLCSSCFKNRLYWFIGVYNMAIQRQLWSNSGKNIFTFFIMIIFGFCVGINFLLKLQGIKLLPYKINILWSAYPKVPV